MFTLKFNATLNKNNVPEEEPSVMTIDEHLNWQLERGRSKKVCLDRGVCVFIAGFSREYQTLDHEQDLPIRYGFN